MKADIFLNMSFQYFKELNYTTNIVKYFLSANFFLHLSFKFVMQYFQAAANNKIFSIFVPETT
jgi:hypothetical protein